MATMTAPYVRSIKQQSEEYRNPIKFRPKRWLGIHGATLNPAVSVLGMAGYFLLLGSIAVVVITRQFPWFMAVPMTILLAYAYFKMSNTTGSNHSK